MGCAEGHSCHPAKSETTLHCRYSNEWRNIVKFGIYTMDQHPVSDSSMERFQQVVEQG